MCAGEAGSSESLESHGRGFGEYWGSPTAITGQADWQLKNINLHEIKF